MSRPAARMDCPQLLARLCAPTDAVGPDPAPAVALLRELGLDGCELRTVDGQEVLDLPASRRRDVAALLRQAGMSVALLSTDIGRGGIEGPAAPQRERLQRALELAALFCAPGVRVYAYTGPETRRGEAVERLARFAELAAGGGVTLLVENLPGTYGASGRQLGELIRAVGSPALGALFNPAGFAARKEHPFLSAFSGGPLKRQLRCLRVRDGTLEDGAPVPPGEGNGELKEIISALMARCYDGLFSLDPGLSPSPAGFRAALEAYRAMVDSLL